MQSATTLETENFSKKNSAAVSDVFDLCKQQLQALQGKLQQQGCAKGERLATMMLLRQYLNDVVESLEQKNRYQALNILNQGLAIAEKLSDWPLVIMLREELSPLLTSKEALTENYLLLSLAHRQLGEIFLAISKLRQALLLSSQDARLYELWQDLNNSLNKPEAGQIFNQDLQLIPLSSYHIEDFAWQYDERIETLCNLPRFSSEKEWQMWLADMNWEPNRNLFALCHHQWGFIGSVCLQVFNGVGFFYYWVGNDFQGMGFGPQAVNLLLDFGYRYKNMHCCYAKIYEENTYSHQAIKKLGFKQLPHQAKSPSDNEVFYHLGPEKNQQQTFAELHYLLQAMDSDVRLEPEIDL